MTKFGKPPSCPGRLSSGKSTGLPTLSIGNSPATIEASPRWRVARDGQICTRGQDAPAFISLLFTQQEGESSKEVSSFWSRFSRVTEFPDLLTEYRARASEALTALSCLSRVRCDENSLDWILCEVMNRPGSFEFVLTSLMRASVPVQSRTCTRPIFWPVPGLTEAPNSLRRRAQEFQARVVG